MGRDIEDDVSAESAAELEYQRAEREALGGSFCGSGPKPIPGGEPGETLDDLRDPNFTRHDIDRHLRSNPQLLADLIADSLANRPYELAGVEDYLKTVEHLLPKPTIKINKKVDTVVNPKAGSKSHNAIHRAITYVSRMPPAISGQHGHDSTFSAARAAAGFGLSFEELMVVLRDYNARSDPPWSEIQLSRKASQALAARVPREFADRWEDGREDMQRERSTNTDQTSEATRASPVSVGQRSTETQVSNDFLALLRGYQTETDRSGNTRADLSSISNTLLTHQHFEGAIAFDELSDRIIKTRSIPILDDSPTWVDADTKRTAIWLHAGLGIKASSHQVDEAVCAISNAYKINPVARYLTGLVWDGIPRVSTWLHRYARAQLNDHVTNIGSKWLVSAVARALSPGVQVDCALVLVGPQGCGKTSVLRILGGPYHSDSDVNVEDKSGAEVLRGVWIVEFGEMAAMSQRNRASLKQFMSARCDHYRPAYAVYVVDRPRRCVFAGTTNDGQFLHDPTGARRWWPVDVGNADLEGLARDRDQIWAEAVQLYRSGVTWHVDTDTLRESCEAEAEKRTIVDPWVEPLARWLAQAEILSQAAQGLVTGPRVLSEALEIPVDRQDRRDQMRLAECLKQLGWLKGDRLRIAGARTYPYYPPTSEG